MGCVKEIILPDHLPEFNKTYFDYDPESTKIYLYTEIEIFSTTQVIDSVWADVYNQSGAEILTAKLLQTNNFGESVQNLHAYSYKETLFPFESGNYRVQFHYKISDDTNSLMTNSKYLSVFEGNASPEFISWEVPIEFQINATEWTDLPISLTIFDLNGKDNIQDVTYEVKRYFGSCEGDCIIDPNCNDIIEDTEFQSHETWNFEFIQYNDAGFSYFVIIKMRPLDGSSYEDEYNQFDAEDCGRMGLILIRFIITDVDGNQIVSDELPIEIVAP